MSAVVRFEDVELDVQADPTHGWLMSNAAVEAGFGVPQGTVRSAKSLHSDEFVEGKHFANVLVNSSVEQVGYGRPPARPKVMWTKRGVVRLGFHLEGERARRFRDFAEDLVISAMEPAAPRYAIPQTSAAMSCTRAARCSSVMPGVAPEAASTVASWAAAVARAGSARASWTRLGASPLLTARMAPGAQPSARSAARSFGTANESESPRFMRRSVASLTPEMRAHSATVSPRWSSRSVIASASRAAGVISPSLGRSSAKSR